MTRKDYIRIADALSRARQIVETRNDGLVWEECVDRIADALKEDNPLFDRARFNAACTG